MKKAPHKIAIAIPVEDLPKTFSLLEKAINAGADFVELRLDYYSDLLGFPLSTLQEYLQKSTVPLIFTCRASAEGGQSDITEEKRLDFIKKIIEISPEYLDIEAMLPKGTLEEIYSLAQKNKVKLIYSYHDFQRTPSITDAHDLYYALLYKCPGLEEDNENILKIIFTANNESDNRIPIQLCRMAWREERKIVSFCMGEKGKSSRVNSVKSGAFFTFASLEKTTAPGQLAISDLKRKWR